MAPDTRLAHLRQLSEQAQRMAEQSRRLAQRADQLATLWRSAQIDPRSGPLPAAFEYDALHLAVELETMNTELSGQLELERSHLAAAQARLTAILDAMGDAVLVVDASGAPLLTNHAYEELMGPAPIALEDEQGDTLPEPDSPSSRAAQGETFSLSFVARRGDGSRRWCEANGRPVQHAGEAHGVVVIRDITERTMRRLQDEFLALASHEFRTPLTPARGYLELIPAALAARDNDRVAHFAAAALEQILHLDALVSDVLDVGRLQGGALRLEREWLDFAAVVERAAVAARMQEGAPPIEVDLPDEPVPVEGDVRRLEQVVANLLSNAIVHAATPRIQVRLRRAEGAAVLEVQDDGRGIPATDLPRLFSRFYQVERPDRPSRGGLGLGLYLVQELVEAHGGTVTVVSTPGQGTTFTVRLALTPGE